MRGGLLSSFSVPGAGMLTSVELYCDGRHGREAGMAGVAFTPLQVRPAWDCWSAVRPLRSTRLAAGQDGRCRIAGLFGSVTL